MGLDIRYFCDLHPEPDAALDAEGSPLDFMRYVTLFQAYKGTKADWPKVVAAFPHTDQKIALSFGFGGGHFRAGSYSSYGWWRDTLAKAVGWTDGAQQVWETVGDAERGNAQDQFRLQATPEFVELINFSDCEGLIDHVTSEKLARDFERHSERVAKYAEEKLDAEMRQYFLRIYHQFATAFRTAASNGAVLFC